VWATSDGGILKSNDFLIQIQSLKWTALRSSIRFWGLAQVGIEIF
jgi:hypothetical protein